MLREVREETGLDADVGETARVYSAHLPGVWRDGRRVDAHALRIVYDGWVAPDAPEPRVVEVDGSTSEAAWHPVAEVVDGELPVAPLVLEALADHQPFRQQRVGAYALIRAGCRDAAQSADTSTRWRGEGDVLLVQFSERGFHTGSWSLPGGGLGHGESPRPALEREVQEECGVACAVGELLAVHDEAFSGTAPSGRFEDFHAVLLVFAGDGRPRRRAPRGRGRRHHRGRGLGAGGRREGREAAGARRRTPRPRGSRQDGHRSGVRSQP